MSATRLLSRGWFRGRLGGWLGTASVLAMTLVLLLLVAAMFQGIQDETERRVGDVFTGEARVTPISPGVFGPGRFADASEAAAALGSDTTIRMESQAILSRRNFESVLVQGDSPPVLQGPGGTGGKNSVSLGVMIGADFSDPRVAPAYERHLVSDGRLPGDWSPDDDRPIPVAISVRTLGGFLTQSDKDGLSSWPPPIAEVRALPLEVTAGVARDGDYRNDVYRHPAVIVGLYDTGVETLDSFTVWAAIEGARFLLGEDPADDVANVLIIGPGDDVAAASAHAESNGWAVEGRHEFTGRYLGQLIDALRVLSIATAAVLFSVPAFLVAHGVERLLDAQRKEIAVLRAIGVPGRSIRQALGRLVTWMLVLSLVAAGLLSWIAGVGLHQVLPDWDGAPVPLDVSFTWQAAAAALVVATGSVAVAFWIAVRGHTRGQVIASLRAT